MTTPTDAELEEMIAEVGREIGLRVGVYPKLVKSGRMTQREADQRSDAMRKVYRFLKELKRQRLPQRSLPGL